MKRRFYKVPKGANPRQEVNTDPENLVLPQDMVKGLQMGSRLVCFERSELTGKARQFVAVGEPP